MKKEEDMAPTITVDFDVWKEITSRRTSEGVSDNDVLRDALGLGNKNPPKPQVTGNGGAGAVFKGVTFPDGTQFRASYKGRTYTAAIRNGLWTDSDGSVRNSPSEAAVKITGKPWNGWRFWHCKRPGDVDWVLIDTLR
jgi:hypothetical protein